MAAELLRDLSRASDANNNPLPGATWEFYASGTLTPQTVFADAKLNTPLGAAVAADAGGKFPSIYMDRRLSYRARLCDAGGGVVADIDPINTAIEPGILVTVDDYGAVGDGTTDDLAAFEAARDSLIAAGGGTLRLGNKTYALAGTFALDSGNYSIPLRLVGEGTGSVLKGTGTASVLRVGGAMYLRNGAVRDVHITNTMVGGHLVEFGALGTTLFDFSGVNLTQQNPTRHLIYAPSGEIYDSRFHGGDWYLPTNTQVSAVHVRTQGTTFNENRFENLRCYNSRGTVPFFDIENTNTTTWLTNNSFENINFEICQGGGIRFANARGWSLKGLTFWDAHGVYTGHLIHCANNAGYESLACTLERIQRHGDTLAAGIRDIFAEDLNWSEVRDCFTPADAGPSYDWAGKALRIYGLHYNELNAGNTVALGGLRDVSFNTNVDVGGGMNLSGALNLTGGLEINGAPILAPPLNGPITNHTTDAKVNEILEVLRYYGLIAP